MKNFFKKIKYKLVLALSFCISVQITFAQEFLTDSLQQKFISYQTNNYNEKIFVHTDKTFYLTGESIWFKIYCVDECFHKPTSISKIVYVEIINKENKSVLQAKIAINNGYGNGSFIIPSFVSSANYIIRAYTKWMENFDAEYFFQSQLTIFNNLKNGIEQEAQPPKSYTITFFPEGGNLVEDITSKVAFKVVDAFGEPLDCNGNIVDEHNNVVTNFQSLKFGMGNFSFTPKAGASYKAVVKLADTTIEKALPSVYKQGYVMHLENAENNKIKITLSSNLTDDQIYLLAHSRNVIKDFHQSKLAAGEAIFLIDKSKLSDGISDITIFNSNKQPVCERLYFKKPASKLNIQIQPDKNIYQPEKQVNVSLNTAYNSKPAVANMSVSVFMIDSLQSENYTDILSYLLLNSELKGNISSPEYYFQSSNKAADEAADNLMLTQGWRRFKWEDILAGQKPFFEFIPEHEGMLINGSITGRYNALSKENLHATLTVPGKNFQLSGAQSNASGDLLFNVRNFYGENDIIVQADSNYKVEIASPYSDKFSSAAFTEFKMPLQWKNQLLYRSINVQAENAYFIDKKQRSYVYSVEDTSLFYGAPNKRYYLDDYTRFTTMEEVMREYVAEVHVRKEASQFHFKVENFLTNTYFDNDPLVLLDGLPVLNTNSIIEFDPLKIKRLDVIAGRHYYGNIVNDGILSYATYNGDLANFQLNGSDVVVKFDGLQREREFYSPVYNDVKTKKYIPDLRNVLYWSPNVQTDINGKTSFSFYTSGITGRFACIVQGITPDGAAGSNIIIFNVTNQ
jgi:hypothetical protein